MSEAKEHSTNGVFLCVGKQTIQTSKDISEAQEAFCKANQGLSHTSMVHKRKRKNKHKRRSKHLHISCDE